MRKRLLTVALLVSAMAAFAGSARAQGGCVAFRAITQAQWPSPYQNLNMPLLDVWGGTVFASLGTPGAQKAAIGLVGVFSGADADNYETDVRPRTFGGMGLHGAYTFAFGDPGQPWDTYTDKFTVTLGRAVWNMGPGQVVGDYQASGQITAGTGRFAGATGSLTIQGPAFDVVLSPELEIARWTPEIAGTICGVK